MNLPHTLQKKIEFLKALAIFLGTIVGVGIFSLPYVAMKSGFVVVLGYFILVAILAIIVQSLLGEVARDTHKIARIPGYAEEYIGPGAKKIAFAISSLGLIGVLLAYLILGGNFLYALVNPLLGGPVIIYVLIFFAAGAAMIFSRTRNVARFELIMFIVFLALLFIFVWNGLPHINFKYFSEINKKFITFPYGIVLFSLWGIALVPEVKEIVERDRRKLKAVITWGVIIAALCYLIFIFTFLGVSGPNTTRDAITGFSKNIGNDISGLGYFFGLITSFASFIALGMTLKKIFWLDFHWPKNLSWAVASFTPLLLYFFGFKNFIDIIGLTGAFMLGLEAIMVIFIYRSFIKKRFCQKAPWWLYLLIAFFVVGMVLQFIYFFTVK
ncbi:MAG: amino acid permease [Candidatus Parcubacteria bacterium]|nr:amino acid permease [Candidatus Parcubacteria bacterium]